MDESQGFVDQVLDDILPDNFDWRGMVVEYPLTAMALSVAGGFWLGRNHGLEVLSGLKGYAMNEVSRNFSNFMDGFGAATSGPNAYSDDGYGTDGDYADQDYGLDDDYDDEDGTV